VSIAAWLNQVIWVASCVGIDAYGKALFASPRQVRARVEAASRLVRTARGEQVSSQARVYTSTAIALTDRVWLPSDDVADTNSSRAPIAVKSTPDKTGARTLWEIDL
jgi:hypothetical protein